MLAHRGVVFCRRGGENVELQLNYQCLTVPHNLYMPSPPSGVVLVGNAYVRRFVAIKGQGSFSLCKIRMVGGATVGMVAAEQRLQ